MSSSGPLVLITGITGFLAQHVLAQALSAPQNFRVRGTVRSLTKSQSQVLSNLPGGGRDQSRVELVEVADTASSDLSAALQDVTYVIHVASPYIIHDITDPKKQLLEPAVDGTLNVLRHAKDSKTIKRIAITSSFAAVTDFQKGGPNRPGFTYTPQDWMPLTEQDAIEKGGAIAYSVSKKLAEKAAWDFLEKEKPSWDLVTLNPPMIYGPSVAWATKKSLNTSSKAIYNLISNASQMPDDRLPLFCDVDDVGAAHVLALTSADVSNKRVLLWGGSFNWSAAVHYIAKKYPELKKRLPRGWEESTPKGDESYAALDTTLAKQALGIKFKTWEQTLDDCVEDLLKLEKSEQWES